MNSPAAVGGLVVSNDTTQSSQTDNKLDQIKSEALKKYQALQTDRQASYVEGPSTPGTAKSLDAELNTKALNAPGLQAMAAAQHTGIVAFKSLEGLLLDTEPLAKPLAQFEATLPKGTPTSAANINFSPNFMRALPVGSMLGIVASSGSSNLIAESFSRVASKITESFARGEITLDNLDFNKSTLAKSLPPQQRAAMAEAFKPIVAFLNKQSGAIAKGQRPPSEDLTDADIDADDDSLLGSTSSDDSAAGLDSPAQLALTAPAKPVAAGSTPSSAQMTPIPPIPGSLEGQAGQAVNGMLANGTFDIPPGMDIDALVQMVMSDCELGTESDLQKMAEGMQTLNAQKAAQRKLEEAYSQASSKMTNAMQQEFGALQQAGKIGTGWTFDDYSAWRQVVIAPPQRDGSNNLVTDADGNPQMAPPELAQPSPPTLLPPRFAQPKIPPPASATASAKGRVAGDVGDDYGLTTAQVSMLKSIYHQYFEQSDIASGMGVAGDDTDNFNNWLSGGPLGLSKIDPGDNTTTGVTANNAAIDSFLQKMKSDPADTIGLNTTSSSDLQAIQALCASITTDYPLPAQAAGAQQALVKLQRLYGELYMNPGDLNTAAQAIVKAITDLKAKDLGKDGKPANPPSLTNLPDVSAVTNVAYGAYASDTAEQLASVSINGNNFANIGSKMYVDPGDGSTPGDDAMAIQTMKCVPAKGSIQDGIDTAVTAAQAIQTPIDADLSQNANFFAYGFSTEQIQAISKLYTEFQNGDFGNDQKFTDINAFIAAVGLQKDDGTDTATTQTENAQALQQFVSTKMAASLPNTEELAKTNAQLGLIGNAFDPTVYNLPAGYTNELQKMWVDMPESERTKFGDSFNTFLTAPNGASLAPGGTAQTNEAAIRTYAAGVPELAADLPDLDQLENPTDHALCGFTASSNQYQLVQDLWNNLDPATRTAYGNNINAWLADAPPKGLGFKSGAFNANIAAITAYCATATGTAPDGSSWSDAETAAAAGTYAPPAPTSGLFDDSYMKFLHDKGFVGDPPPPATPTAGLAGQNTQTGDMGTTLAQNLPTDIAGGQLCSLAQIANLKSKADDDLQSMSDVGELQMMKLQLVMDQRSKLLESISNVMKKISDTRDGIIANYKS